MTPRKIVINKEINKRRGMISEFEYQLIHKKFSANISKWDCGKKCSPLNEGMGPVCCDTNHAVPNGEKSEFDMLMKKSELWHPYPISNNHDRRMRNDMPRACGLYQCKGAAFCERDNRSMSCRTFPFHPFITKKNEFIGLSIYWNFSDRCWLQSNIDIVNQQFIDEFVDYYDFLFHRDDAEAEAMYTNSRDCERYFKKLGKNVPVLSFQNEVKEYVSATDELKLAKVMKFAPFRNEREYKAAIKAAEGEYPKKGLKPE